jgi:hypothetical protein
MKFPHANNSELEDRKFIALWAVWFDGEDSRGGYTPKEKVPMLAQAVGYQKLVDGGRGHGIDALCRLAVAPQYRNTMHATNKFVDENLHLLERSSSCINHSTRRNVKSVKLTPHGMILLDEVLEDETLMADAERIVEADTEIVTAEGEVSQLTNQLIAQLAPISTSSKPRFPFSDLEDIVKALVDDIESAPFQATYRKKLIGEIVSGWSSRLAIYFWPNPKVDYSATTERMAGLMADARAIADAQFPWDESAKKDSLVFAEKVFQWGGVPQRNLTSEQIEKVARAALLEENDNALMNSGWTKIAAFLTAHLESENQSQAIWDSRVSYSLVRRLDCLLFSAQNQKIPSFLKFIGKVPGRGGTRWAARLNFDWPNGYGRWDAHRAASLLVRKIRDELNVRNIQAPMPSGGVMPWSVRTVEMVLFMDGY